MSEATPRPWKLKTEQDQDFITRTVVGPNLGAGTEVAIITTGSYEDRMESANAKLIVRAVNNHDALLEAAKNFVQWSDECWGSWAINSEDTPKAKAQYDAAKAAIAAAEASE